MIENFHDINHEFFMKEALKEAEEAGKRGDRPIGCVIVHNGVIISRGSNRISTMDSDLDHAETNAMRQCASYLKKHARECILYTTVEPCMMCLSTLIVANLRHVVFAVQDKYLDIAQFIDSTPYIKDRLYNYLGGVMSDESSCIIKYYSPFMAEVVLNGRRPR